MSKYIERENAIAWFMPYAHVGESIDADVVISDIRGMKSADVAPVQKWISVKDRLPEEEGLYLVAVVNDHERRYSKTAWYHGHGNWFLHQKVTHWMLLPEPPKGE